MDAFYNEIKAVHIAAVLASGALFALRGVSINGFDARWPVWAPVHHASYVIDTILLAAALMLIAITRNTPSCSHGSP